jgi:hypothetical protein
MPPVTPNEESMTVSEDVVRDLLPLYFEGEASPGSRTLVETWFARHPDFARTAKHGSDTLSAFAAMNPPPLDPSGARDALGRVRRIMFWREVTLGLAIALSVCPILVVAFGLAFPAYVPKDLHDKLALCVALFLLLAATVWAAYLVVRRKVGVR